MKDNFSRQAAQYALYRPGYPRALFNFILQHVMERNAAWDCATGNGQAAKDLAHYFGKVFATDISRNQLEKATKANNIFYSVQPAEKTNFGGNSFDLITVSQALHWLKFELFYTEVKRVAKPGAWLAAWMYSLPVIDPETDERLARFYKETIGGYWDYERRYVDEKYTTLPFPFEEITCPGFKIECNWTMEMFRGYLESWSAVQQFITTNGYDPVNEFMQELAAAWQGDRVNVVFPLTLRMGRINK